MATITPQQWATQAQGTMDAILRCLAEIIARHPERQALLASLLIQDQLSADASTQAHAQHAAEEECIQSILRLARVALARAEALKADPSSPH